MNVMKVILRPEELRRRMSAERKEIGITHRNVVVAWKPCYSTLALHYQHYKDLDFHFNFEDFEIQN